MGVMRVGGVQEKLGSTGFASARKNICSTQAYQPTKSTVRPSRLGNVQWWSGRMPQVFIDAYATEALYWIPGVDAHFGFMKLSWFLSSRLENRGLDPNVEILPR